MLGLQALKIFRFFQRGHRLYTWESDVCRRQILTQTQMHLFGRKYKTYNFLDVHKHKTI